MSDWGGDWGDSASTNGESNSSFGNGNGRNSSSRGNFSRNQTSSYSSASFGDAPSSSLKIHGFDCCIGPNDIREIFGRFGHINSLCFFYPTHTPGGNATCWLTYATSESAPIAIKKFNGRELRGRELTITSENPPFNGSSSGGDFNSGFSSNSSSIGPMRGGRMGGSRPSGCFNCNKDGHMARDCPEPKKERRGSDRFSPYPRGGGRSGGFGGSGNANETPLGSGDTTDGWGGSGAADDWSTPTPAPANHAPAAVPKVEETKPAPAADEGW